MSRIVEARLTSWEPGIPGIWFRYENGIEVNSDARVRSAEVIQALQFLTDADLAELQQRLEASRALDRS